LVGRWASPNIPHARSTHSEVELRKCCLGQSEKSKIPYHLVTIFKEISKFKISKHFINFKKMQTFNKISKLSKISQDFKIFKNFSK
jgi:hypothetical protein